MSVNRVSDALRERLGPNGAVGLLELIESYHAQQEKRVLSIAVERFERRLNQELGNLPVALVREVQETRAETIKWAFLFWVSQATAFLALLAFIYRGGIR